MGAGTPEFDTDRGTASGPDRLRTFPRGRWTYRVEARSLAPVEEVWPLLAEAARWREWSFLDHTGVERSGVPDPDGVGAVRRFTRWGAGSREEVVVVEPPRHLGYVILSGVPVRNYRADIDLSPDGADGSGTRVSWSGSFDALIPGTGPILGSVLPRMIAGFASGVARYAERHPGTRTPG
jgi:hypothetical protein